jgi:hypothetical protein
MTDQRHSPSFASEILRYLKTQKRWWLTPIILVLLFLALVALLAGLAPALPFIYTLF